MTFEKDSGDQEPADDTEGQRWGRTTPDEKDTEGHKFADKPGIAADDDDTEGHKFADKPGVAADDDDTEGHKFADKPGVTSDDDDTEGHRIPRDT